MTHDIVSERTVRARRSTNLALETSGQEPLPRRNRIVSIETKPSRKLRDFVMGSVSPKPSILDRGGQLRHSLSLSSLLNGKLKH